VEKATVNNNSDPAQMAMLTEQFKSNGYTLLVSVFSWVIEFFGTFLALIRFATLLPGEIERGSIKFLISKPVSRLEVVLGKWAGGTLVLFCYSVGTSVLQMLSSLYLTGGITPDDFRALPFRFCKLFMRGSVVMCLSVAMKPILAGVLAFFISGDIFWVFARFTAQAVIHYLLLIISYLLPNYATFPVRSSLGCLAQLMGSGATDLSMLDIAARCGYALIYAALMLFLTAWQFERKDLT
jgi:ABC-type transport system involved in multi-copper enzyme maturation permease subunit